MRLDKWLWTARFFKTRQLAVEAISSGKIHLNGRRTKPGKEVRPGTRLRIHKDSLEWEIQVLGLAGQRRPASEATLLYAESDESKARRDRQMEEQRLLRAGRSRPAGKPSKRDRRMIRRFIQTGE